MDGKNVSILILSCDKYDDLWMPFFTLKEKYWSPCNYTTYIATDTKDCPYAITLKHDYPVSMWTKRIRESLMQIPTKYVIMMDGDYFFRNRVDQERIDYCVSKMNNSIACFSFEQEFAPTLPCEFQWFRLKPNMSQFLSSCQAGLWDKQKLIDSMSEDMNPWEWEEKIVNSPYKYYVNSYAPIIDYGHYKYGDIFGVYRSKWVKDDVVPLFEREHIDIDFSKRGFY
jgi:hypothetical protein